MKHKTTNIYPMKLHNNQVKRLLNLVFTSFLKKCIESVKFLVFLYINLSFTDKYKPLLDLCGCV